MSVIRDPDRRTWRVYIRYKDWQGKQQIHTKRGFATKREARDYERAFLQKQSRDINMSFADFADTYMSDMKPRLKLNTYLSKEYLIRTKIIPYFGELNLAMITPTDVIKWQNELLLKRDEDGRPYAQTYLRTIQNQLSAIFNHACRYYGLSENPSTKAGKMGKAKSKEMLFWTKEEYSTFIKAMIRKPVSYYAFELLYWCGIREGELLALTRKDFDLEKKKLFINKSFQSLQGKHLITTPKTEKSNRTIDLPDFLCDEMEDYFGMLYRCDPDTRLFCFSKSYLHHEMDRGCKETGVKRIRIHDLRHSHVAHLIELGFSPVEIAERLGHEGIAVTLHYSHLYPSKQAELADRLNRDHNSLPGEDNNESKPSEKKEDRNEDE